MIKSSKKGSISFNECKCSYQLQVRLLRLIDLSKISLNHIQVYVLKPRAGSPTADQLFFDLVQCTDISS